MVNTIKSPIVVLFLLAVLASTPRAQMVYVGTVSLYADSLWSTSEAFDTGPGILTVYVVHDNNPTGDPHSAIWFKIEAAVGFTGVWITESSPHPTVVGTSPSGIAIGYAGPCVATPVHVLTITYALSGTSAPNSYIEVVANPDASSGLIETVPCVGFINYCDGGRLTINPTVPAGRTTWGQIKATYR